MQRRGNKLSIQFFTTVLVQPDLPVYVFNGTTYTGFSARTDAAGLAQLTLPEGNYRFRTDLNGAQYFSSTENHCAIPTCTSAAITTPVYGSVAVSVIDSASSPLSGLPVYAFNGATYTGRSGTTDASGQVTLNLPEGNYRFRSDLNGQQYFSAATNHCTVPECTNAQITAAVFGEVTITVADNSGTFQAGLPVYAFTGSTYTGFNGTTDENGQVTLNLPQNNYRFRADLHGAQYFSSTENACAVPACTTASVTTPVYGEVTISVQSSQAQGQPDLPVYVFNGTTYTGLSGVTGADGTVTLWIPAGSYRFRADQFELQFYSAEENHCTVPECTTATVSTLGMQQVEVNQTIDYTYDPLNRLTSAVYDDGSFYQYTYDAVGNRLTETTPTGTDTYIYNSNNWVVQKNDTSWSYDAAGNLRSDGVRNYDYDAANRLKWVSDRSAYVQTSYAYNGLGDRLQSTLLYYPTGESTTTNYTLDLNTNMTQVLADGSNTYTYGYNRISQISNTQTGYFLGDALGSVRQIADDTGAVNLVQSYSPYGEVISSVGSYGTAFSYTGEMSDGTGLVYLRARYYDPATGRFINKDTWGGDYNNPITLAKWLYANGNPVIYTDPSGNISCTDPDSSECIAKLQQLLTKATKLKSAIANNNYENYALMPVEALAELTDYAFELFDYDRRGMMWGMTRVLVGIEPTDYKFIALQPVNEILLKYTGFENQISSGLHSEYSIGSAWLPYKEDYDTNSSQLGDWNPNYFDGTANQAFHFWYYAASRYFDGAIFGNLLANVANVVHDPFFLESEFLCGPDLENWKDNDNLILSIWAANATQTSQEDFNLGSEGIQFGNYMSNPFVIGIDPGKWIRNHLKAKEYRK